MLAFDFETALIEPGLQAPPPVCMSLAAEQSLIDTLPLECAVRVPTPHGAGYVLSAENGLDLLEHVLGKIPIVGLSTSFDLVVAAEARPSLVPRIFEAYDKDLVTDVIVDQKLIDIAMGEKASKYSMTTLAERLLDVHVEKEDTWRLRYWELAHLPLSEWPQDALDYPAGDAIVTLTIHKAQHQELQEIDRLIVLDDQHRRARGDFALRLASVWGLRTDVEGCRILRENCEARSKELERQLLRAGLLKYKYKGRKPNKVVVGISKDMKVAKKRILDAAIECAEKGEDPWKTIRISESGLEAQRTGGDWRQLKFISTDKEACRDSDDLLMQDYSEYSQLASLLSGFMPAVEQGVTVPIHTRFNVLLRTGRTSSTSPNVQNIRKTPGARECFIPRSGYCYIGCDIDRAELHTLAQCCINLFGRSTLGDTLNSGIDTHTKLGARLAKTTYEDLVARLKAKDPVAKELRQRAKPANFGLPGGMGPAGLRRYAKGMYRVVLSITEAREIVDEWREEYPDVAYDYLGYIKSLFNGKEKTTIEHFDSHRWRGGCSFCAAANSHFQGMAADALIKMLWELSKRCYVKHPGSALYGCRIVNEVHDEVLIEAPLAQASDAAHEMQKTMVDAYNTYTRDVPVKATPALMDRWSKDAETIVEDGVYKIWHYERKAV